jgi:hypothetical protein
MPSLPSLDPFRKSKEGPRAWLHKDITEGFFEGWLAALSLAQILDCWLAFKEAL